MSQFDYENSKDAMNEQAKRNYKSEIDGDGDAVKGFHMYKTPYLWEEENPISNMDTPTENFIPTPTYDANEDTPRSKVKRAIKIGLLILFAAFMIYALIMQFIDSPQVFRFRPITW